MSYAKTWSTLLYITKLLENILRNFSHIDILIVNGIAIGIFKQILDINWELSQNLVIFSGLRRFGYLSNTCKTFFPEYLYFSWGNSNFWFGSEDKKMFPQGVVLLMITSSMQSSSALSNLRGPRSVWRRAHISEKPSLRETCIRPQCGSRAVVGILPGKKQKTKT